MSTAEDWRGEKKKNHRGFSRLQTGKHPIARRDVR